MTIRTHRTPTQASAPSVLGRIRRAVSDVTYANRRIVEIQAGVRNPR